MDAAEVFWALHSDLPREGVGSDATTRALLESTAPLPASPRALDVGCGPGRACPAAPAPCSRRFATAMGS